MRKDARFVSGFTKILTIYGRKSYLFCCIRRLLLKTVVVEAGDVEGFGAGAGTGAGTGAGAGAINKMSN